MNKLAEWLLGANVTGAAGEGVWQFAFTAEFNNYIKLGMILAYVLVFWLIVRSYRREGQTPRKVKITLATIRLVVLTMVFMILLQPAMVLVISKNLYKSVVFLVDDSQSMSFKDAYINPAERKKMAEFLGVSEAELSTMPRSEIIRRALSRDEGPLAKLSKDHPIEIKAFSTTQPGKEAYTRTLGKIDMVDSKGAKKSTPASMPAQTGPLLGKLTAAGYDTNLSQALRDIYDQLQGKRVAGVVILSDFQMTAGGRLAGAISYGDEWNILRYPVLVGDPTPPKNLSVTSLEAPQEAWANSRVELTATVTQRNIVPPGQTTPVQLNARLMYRAKPANGEQPGEWKDAGVSQTVEIKPASQADEGGNASQKVALYLEPKEVGQFEYRVIIDPLDDEQNKGDNFADVTMSVSEEKINVLLISGDAGWEFQYIKSVLFRQKELYRVSIWQQNADPDVNQAASTGMKLTKLPRTLEELIGSPGGSPHPGYRIVILYDPEPTDQGFDEHFVKDMLEPFVAKHNGGLCYIASNKNTEKILTNGAYSALWDMLPVILAGNESRRLEHLSSARPEPWRMVLTPYGVDHPMMRLGKNVEESLKVWDVLPGIFWSQTVKQVKLGARVLAENGDPSRKIQNKNEPEPLVVVQPYGSGRVAYMGTDETWRWRYLNDGQPHKMFWNNVVRFLAMLKARQVTITAGNDRFFAGDEIVVEVEAYDEKENYRPLKADAYEVDMVDKSTGQTTTIVCKPIANKEGRFRGSTTAVHTGVMELTSAALRRAGDPLINEKVAAKTIRIDLPQAEANRTEADVSTMENVRSRPEFGLRAYEIDRLVDLIPHERLTAVEKKNYSLWDKNVFLVLIVVLLAIEWMIRKKHNMA